MSHFPLSKRSPSTFLLLLLPSDFVLLRIFLAVVNTSVLFPSDFSVGVFSQSLYILVQLLEKKICLALAYLPVNVLQLYVGKGGIEGRGKEVQDGHVVSMACYKKVAVGRIDSNH